MLLQPFGSESGASGDTALEATTACCGNRPPPAPVHLTLAVTAHQYEASSTRDMRKNRPAIRFWLRSLAFPVLGAATVCAQTTNTFLNVPFDTIPGISPTLLSLHLVTRSDFTNRPVFIYVHGGSWESGDKNNVGVKDDYALQRGYVFATLNYRLTTTNLATNVFFPAHVQDIATALAWLYRNATNYGGDPRQLYLSGHSAGSHLVALVASDPRWLAAHGLTPDVLRAVIPNDTLAYDLPYFSLPSGTLGATYTDIFSTDPGMWAFSSPATYARGGRGIPPMAFCYSAGVTPTLGQANQRRRMATNFLARLTDAAVPGIVINGSTNLDGSLKSHNEINSQFGVTNDNVTLAAFDFIEHVSPFSRLRFRNDWTNGATDTNGVFMNGTETMSLAGHGGKLFAATGVRSNDPQGDPTPGPQVLRKDHAAAPWIVDRSWGTEFLRVDCLQSITFTTDRFGNVLVPPRTLLLASANDVVAPRHARVWSRDDATGQWTEMVLATNLVDHAYARIIFSHVDGVTGVQHVFAGVATSALYRGGYDDSAPGKIVWDATPELTGTERMHSACAVNGVLHVAVGANGNTNDLDGGLFRRVEGANAAWQFLAEWPASATPGLRGLTAVPDPNGGAHQVLLGGLEQAGVLLRFDPSNNYASTIELNYESLFTNNWGTLGRPATVAAYNDLLPVTDPATGRALHLVSLFVEHPRTNTPPFNGAHFLVRHPDARYEWARIFDYDDPVPAGKRLRSSRTFCAPSTPQRLVKKDS